MALRWKELPGPRLCPPPPVGTHLMTGPCWGYKGLALASIWDNLAQLWRYTIKINKQKPQLNRVRRRAVGVLTSCDNNRAQQEEVRLLFFFDKDSANEKPWTLCSLQPSQLPFPRYKRVLLPSACRDLHIACQGYRPCITILCWCQIN